MSSPGVPPLVVWPQGMTIKPLVELLEVKKRKRALPTVSEEIHSRVRGGSG